MQRLLQKIKFIRNAYGYTQADMAAFLNIKRETYSTFEQGKTKRINIEFLLKIADILAIDISELLPASCYDTNNLTDYLITINAAEKKLLSLFRQLPTSYKTEILRFVADSKSDYLNTTDLLK